MTKALYDVEDVELVISTMTLIEINAVSENLIKQKDKYSDIELHQLLILVNRRVLQLIQQIIERSDYTFEQRMKAFYKTPADSFEEIMYLEKQ